MKKLTIISQIVLFVAVIVLFILHFKGTSCKTQDVANDSTKRVPVNSTIAYVSIDSVVAKYQMSIDLSGEIQKKGQQLDADLSVKSKSFQSKAQDFTYKAQKGLEVRSKLEEMQQNLQAEEQNLYKLRDSYAQQIQEEHSVMLRKVMESIMSYLKEYNKDKKYQFILGNSFDGKILYADDRLDITEDVIKGLNEHYKSQAKDEKK